MGLEKWLQVEGGLAAILEDTSSIPSTLFRFLTTAYDTILENFNTLFWAL